MASPVLAAALVLAALLLKSRPPEPPLDRGPLLLANGSALGTLESTGTPRAVSLDDHSRILLDPETVLEPVVNDGQRFEVALRKGRAAFELSPGHPRKWTLDCGPTIEVMANRFSVWRSETAVEVMVFDGALILRGEQVPGGVHRLTTNQRWTRSLPMPETPMETAPVSVPPPTRTRAVPRPAEHTSWRALATEHKYDEAYRALGRKGVAETAARSSSIEDLLKLADVARLSGHPAEALPVLKRAVDEFPTDRRAALAAFTRGRVESDDLKVPGPAAASFARAIELGLPDLLTEDAFMRLVETRLGADDRDAAQAAMHQYQERFPRGRFAGRMKELIESQ